MGYEVLVEDLRAAAGSYHDVADSLGAEGVRLTDVDPDSVGHIELAAWIHAVADQCHQATTALRDGATGLADGLEAAAHHYESTDQCVATTFLAPFGSGPLLRPWEPGR